MTELENALSARPFPATVAKVLDYDLRIVINRGSKDGVKLGQRFLVYGVGPDVTDPETGESLGEVELIRGSGKAIHVQELMATVESDRVEPGERHVITLNTRPELYSVFGPRQEVEESPPKRMPFDAVSVGDVVKRI